MIYRNISKSKVFWAQSGLAGLILIVDMSRPVIFSPSAPLTMEIAWDGRDLWRPGN
jgi:hypothetical protein